MHNCSVSETQYPAKEKKLYLPPPPPTDSVVGERLSNPRLSPLEEAEEWARIQSIMASFGSGIARESVFMAELEQEFQEKLGKGRGGGVLPWGNPWK